LVVGRTSQKKTVVRKVEKEPSKKGHIKET